jgi:hypothetical protein
MALKKRGFNVDRILNQQREERLRLQAEAVRDREKTVAESPKHPSSAAVISSPDGQERKQSVKSEAGTLSNDSNESDGTKKIGFMEKLRKRKGSKGGAEGATPTVMSELEKLRSGMGTGMGAGMDGGLGKPREGVSTQRVSFLSRALCLG